MRILIISYYYPPIQSVASNRALAFSDYFNGKGHQVDVLTTDVELGFKNTNRVGVNIVRVKSKLLSFIERKLDFLKQSPKALPVSTQSVERTFFRNILIGINQFRIKRGLGYLGRMPDLTDLWFFKSKKWIRTQDPWDVVICTYAPYSSLLLGLYAKSIHPNTILVSDFRDLWTQHHFFKGVYPFKFFERRLESKVLKQSDLVTTVSNELSSIVKSSLKNINIVTVFNGYTNINESNTDHTKYTSKTIFAYTGSLYPEFQNIQPFLKALQIVLTTNPKLYSEIEIIFAGSEQDLVESLIDKYKLKKVAKHIGFISHERSLEIQSNSTFLLHFDYANLPYDGIMPGKIFEYSATGNWIFFIEESGSSAKSYVSACGTGLYSKNDVDSLKTTLNIAISQKANNKPIPNWNHIRQYSRKQQCEKLFSSIELLLLAKQDKCSNLHDSKQG